MILGKNPSVKKYIDKSTWYQKNFTFHFFSERKLHWQNVISEKMHNFLKATKVLLISSNPRSGSSFTGELITAMPNVSYFFEPLWFFGNSPTRTVKEVCKVYLILFES